MLPPRAARRAARLPRVAALAVLLLPAGLRAQDAGGDGPYTRALRLVERGEGGVARSTLDSLVGAAAPASPARAEALWWRAVLAADAADAERDYRTITVDHASSPRAAESWLRLAQLALLRGRPGQAEVELDRLLGTQPDTPVQGRALYWRARARIDSGDPAAACALLGQAAATALPGDELESRIAAVRRQLPRCPATLAAAPAPTAAVPPLAAPLPAASTPTPTPTTSPAATATPGAAPPASVAPRPAPTGPRYAVQLAAYDTRAQATAALARLTARGLDAYLSADQPPFRVRVGRHATRAAAAAELRRLAADGLRGFVAVERAAGEGAR